MKLLITALLSIALLPASYAQESEPEQAMTLEQKIESAMSAAPSRIAKNATIIDRDNSVLREGSNDWTCKTASLHPNSFPWCHDPVFMKWSNTVWKDKPFSTDVVGYSYMLQGGIAGDVNDPHAKGSEMRKGRHHEGPHMMLIMPRHDLLANQSGDPKDDDIFVLFKGSEFEIVIIPLGDAITD
jgi:hypothetical protein